MTDAFRIPKDPAKVVLCVPPDRPEPRLLFLSQQAEHHQGQETVSDLLGRHKRFLPFAEEGDGVRLVRKGAIRWMKVENPAKDEWHYLESREGAPSSRVLVEFAHGAPLEGVIFILTQPGEQRLLDVVNLETNYFHVEADDGLYLVNLEHVTWIGEKGANDAGTR